MAQYNKAFTDVARVTLETDTAGNQLAPASDVKVRGVIVGDVREVRPTPTARRIELAMNPEYVGPDPGQRHRPAAAQDAVRRAVRRPGAADEPAARLSATATSSARTARENAIELQRVIDDLLPLLQAVQPQNLTATLGALATALEGRGDELGDNLAARRPLHRRDQHRHAGRCRRTSRCSADFADTYATPRPTCSPSCTTSAVTSTHDRRPGRTLRRTFLSARPARGHDARLPRENENRIIRSAR